jgi:hypothetical protein
VDRKKRNKQKKQNKRQLNEYKKMKERNKAVAPSAPIRLGQDRYLDIMHEMNGSHTPGLYIIDGRYCLIGPPPEEAARAGYLAQKKLGPSDQVTVEQKSAVFTPATIDSWVDMIKEEGLFDYIEPGSEVHVYHNFENESISSLIGRIRNNKTNSYDEQKVVQV